MIKKKSQIWVETVIYTLIGLSIIGILLVIIKPEIERQKDKLVIEQSIDLLKNIEETINEVNFYGPGNVMPVEVKITKGNLAIIPQDDIISFAIESSYKYSEPKERIEIGEIFVTTEEKAKGYNVSLELDYSGKLNLTFNGKEEEKKFTKAPSPYKIFIKNNGKLPGTNLTNIDISY